MNISYNSITNYRLVSFGTLCFPTKESTYFLLEISDDLFCSAAIVNACVPINWNAHERDKKRVFSEHFFMFTCQFVSLKSKKTCRFCEESL